MSHSKHPILSRQYKSAPAACESAVRLLLTTPCKEKAGEPTPEPAGRDGTKVQEDSANGILPD
jgi:hypothetical protein